MASHPLLTALRDLATPSICALCAMPGPALCAPCDDILPRVGAAVCARCGFPRLTAPAACNECPPAVAWSRQALVYDHAVATVMHVLKDQRRRALAHILGNLMARTLEAAPAGSVLVPIPLSRRGLSDRGFNQAGLLAAALGAAWSLPVHDILHRDDGTAHQRGASRRVRLGQVTGVFRVGRLPVPLHAVLVDDVVTTGSTITAAARALRAAGCARVGAVATARVVGMHGVGLELKDGDRHSEGGAAWNSMSGAGTSRSPTRLRRMRKSA